MYVCVCDVQCFLSKYFYQGCVCVMFQDVSTRGMSSFCISDCFYPGTVDVLCYGSTKGFGLGGGFRMFVPEQCGCFVFQNVCTRAVWVLCVSECFYQRSVCGCFVFENVFTRGVSVGALCSRMFLPEE